MATTMKATLTIKTKEPVSVVQLSNGELRVVKLNKPNLKRLKAELKRREEIRLDPVKYAALTPLQKRLYYGEETE